MTEIKSKAIVLQIYLTKGWYEHAMKAAKDIVAMVKAKEERQKEEDEEFNYWCNQLEAELLNVETLAALQKAAR